MSSTTSPSGAKMIEYEIAILNQGPGKKTEITQQWLNGMLDALVKKLDPDPNCTTEWTLKLVPGPNPQAQLLLKLTVKVIRKALSDEESLRAIYKKSEGAAKR